MRCPYCQALNHDRATYCARCGRNMRLPPMQSTPPPYQQPRQTPPPPPQAVPRVRPAETPVTPPAPDPPAPFPPRTVAQLQALEEGALPYTVVNDAVDVGHKKIVRIAYAKCVPWQQVATLLKACKEHQEERFDTIIIQGVLPQDPNTYSFTNGQFSFDRNVRLGSLITDRYLIETGNGYESDSLRIVLTEQ